MAPPLTRVASVVKRTARPLAARVLPRLDARAAASVAGPLADFEKQLAQLRHEVEAIRRALPGVAEGPFSRDAQARVQARQLGELAERVARLESDASRPHRPETLA